MGIGVGGLGLKYRNSGWLIAWFCRKSSFAPEMFSEIFFILSDQKVREAVQKGLAETSNSCRTLQLTDNLIEIKIGFGV